MIRPLLLATLLSLSGVAAGGEETAEEQFKTLSGMSVLGNNEAPKSLVIVPWKSSEIGDGIGVSNVLDDRAVPVDKDVFIRELDYYDIMTNDGTTPRQERHGVPARVGRR